MHSPVRRRSMMLSAVALGCPRIARAREFPSRPIKLLVPFAAGGPMDLVGRRVAPGAAAELGQAAIVENRTGGTGAVAMAEVARATRIKPTAAFRAALRQPAIGARLHGLGIIVVASTSEEFATMVADQGARYADVFRMAQVPLN